MTNPTNQPTRQSASSSKIRLLIFVLLGCAVLVVLMVGMVAALAWPRLMRARSSASEAAAIATVRTVLTAQAMFAATCDTPLYARSLTVLARTPKDSSEPFLRAYLTGEDRVSRNQYEFWLDADEPVSEPVGECHGASPDQLTRRFVIRAEPVEGEQLRYFAGVEGGLIYQSDRPVTFDANGEVEPPATPIY